jgi:hypothetical protein
LTNPKHLNYPLFQQSRQAKYCQNRWDFKEFCGWSCATRDHEPGGMANRLSAIGVVDSTAGFEALPRQP